MIIVLKLFLVFFFNFILCTKSLSLDNQQKLQQQQQQQLVFFNQNKLIPLRRQQPFQCNNCFINKRLLATNIKQNERLSYQSTNNGISTHLSNCTVLFHTPTQDIPIGTHIKQYPTHWTVTHTIYNQNDKGEIYLTLPYNSNSTHYYSVQCCTSTPHDQDILNVNIDNHRAQQLCMHCPILPTNVTTSLDENQFYNCYQLCQFLLNNIYSSPSYIDCESTLTNLCNTSINAIDSENCSICVSIPKICDTSINCSFLEKSFQTNNYLVNKKIISNNGLSQHKRVTVESFSSDPILLSNNNIIQYHPIASFGSTWFKTDHCNCDLSGCCCISNNCNPNITTTNSNNNKNDSHHLVSSQNDLLRKQSCRVTSINPLVITMIFDVKLIDNVAFIGLSDANVEFLISSTISSNGFCEQVFLCIYEFPLFYKCYFENVSVINIQTSLLSFASNDISFSVYYIENVSLCQKNINISCSSNFTNNIQLSTSKIINVNSKSNHSTLYTIYQQQKKASLCNSYSQTIQSLVNSYNSFDLSIFDVNTRVRIEIDKNFVDQTNGLVSLSFFKNNQCHLCQLQLVDLNYNYLDISTGQFSECLGNNYYSSSPLSSPSCKQQIENILGVEAKPSYNVTVSGCKSNNNTMLINQNDEKLISNNIVNVNKRKTMYQKQATISLSSCSKKYVMLNSYENNSSIPLIYGSNLGYLMRIMITKQMNQNESPLPVYLTFTPQNYYYTCQSCTFNLTYNASNTNSNTSVYFNTLNYEFVNCESFNSQCFSSPNYDLLYISTKANYNITIFNCESESLTLPTKINIQSSTDVKSFQLNTNVECSIPTCCPNNVQCPNGTSCCCTYSQQIVYCNCLTPEECKS